MSLQISYGKKKYNMLTDIVSYRVAKELAKRKLWYYDTITEFYVSKRGYVKCDNDTERVPIKPGDIFNVAEKDNIVAEYIEAPTYANAIDALSIAGIKITIAYEKGFMKFKGELVGTNNFDIVSCPEHHEDQWLEEGIINACELIDFIEKPKEE